MLAKPRPQFETQANQQTIIKELIDGFAQRDALDQNEYNRLPRMVTHYMKEVRTAHGNQPVVILNREVIRACSEQLFADRARNAPAKKPEYSDQDLLVETTRRFEQIQSDRASLMQRDMPAVPNFLIDTAEEKTNAMELFQRAKAMRDEEMKAASTAISPIGAPPIQSSIIVQKPVISLQPTLQQDMLQRKEDILTYKENEYNLFINSVDREWYYDTELNYNMKRENRYDFTVNFNPANNRQGFAITPAAQIKFKNISRIELIKAILPVESVDIFKTMKAAGTSFDAGVNILSFPYVVVNVDELDSNNYGTNNNVDNAFGLIQYDNKWNPEPHDYREEAVGRVLHNPGYVCMIPKFMKCQRVYHPTPLSTLQRMHIRIDRPDGAALCEDMDTFDFPKMALTSSLFPARYAAGNPFASTTGSDYLILESSRVFPSNSISAGDRMYIKGYTFTTDPANDVVRQKFIDFINRKEGHIVAAVQGLNSAGKISPEPNKLGYSKYIIIQGIPDINTGDYADLSAISSAIAGCTINTCRAINGNRQVQLVFRIITKEVDAASRIRPDIL